MNANRKDTGTDWIDPDDAPELDDTFFETADEYRGDTLVKRGRPKANKVKQRVTMRLDPEVVESFKADGPGWQSRINQALKEYIREHS
ncbi:BrnA antitoxin family protein [Chromohalobacter sarecensis]|uniref:BrnA antitoxin family protein n=1 Tax=Chromohalobacter sarecensis TaxID=245294 RepID=A0ABV9CZ88_9GAMM|nr:BrnA antitoxin family protein [Chromohalobacter sarecensis]MCK0714922.1 BrnA antitoxin family protein [Chromohalobacter sarecensis]